MLTPREPLESVFPPPMGAMGLWALGQPPKQLHHMVPMVPMAPKGKVVPIQPREGFVLVSFTSKFTNILG